MKHEFAVIYLIFAIVLLLVAVQIWKYKDEKAKWMKALLSIAFITIVVYGLSLFLNNEVILSYVNTYVFVSEGWLLYIFYGMSYCFAAEGAEIERKRVPMWPIILLVIDTAVMFVGTYSGMSVSYLSVVKNGSVYLHLVPSPGFTMHLAICYSIVAITCYMMVKKANEVSSPYAMAYIGIMMGLLGVVIVNACFLYKEWDLDISILLYAVMAVLLQLYLYHFMSYAVRRQMKTYVVDNMDTPLLFFDMGDHLQIMNEQSEMMLGTRIGMELDEFIASNHIEHVFIPKNQRHSVRNFSLVQDLGNRIYLMQGKELCDSSGRFVGTLFVYYDITREERMKDEATYNATHDKLTGLWNREFFFEMARKKLRDYPDTDYVMIATNIDNFKMFNAILGKKTGDDLLVSISESCKKHFADNRLFGRIAGDRFAILIPKNEFDKDTFRIFENEVFAKKGYSLNVRNYNGVCEITDRSVDPEVIYEWAYMALQSIRGEVNQDFAYFDEKLRKDLIDEALTVDELMAAIKEEQFLMYLQPQIDSVTGDIVGAEALARWESPTRGMVSPSAFIPIFEINGLITYLDYYIWEQACILLRKWQDEGHVDRSISINISAKDFYLSDLYESVTGLVKKYDINPKNLKLEITETAIVLDIEEQMVLVKRFQEFGFLVEMDDFGSGYSSLNSLKNIAVDILKLDMNFLGEASDVKRSEVIIKGMADLAAALKMPVIAEGVESKEQLDFLQSIGCNIIQGFYFSRPLSVNEFEDYIQDKTFADICDYIRPR